MPGVVGLRVVVVVVVVALVLVVVDEVSDSEFDSLASDSRIACSTLSMDIGLGEGVGQPANSVVALQNSGYWVTSPSRRVGTRYGRADSRRTNERAKWRETLGRRDAPANAWNKWRDP